jgi:hypothetical protein
MKEEKRMEERRKKEDSKNQKETKMLDRDRQGTCFL